MEPTIAPTPATLGAIVTGLDLGDMEPATWKAVKAAFLEHALLIFPGQGLTSDEQVAFA